jgi:hypothetical protein
LVFVASLLEQFYLFNNFNPLNAELNPICYLLALLAHHFLRVSRISVKSLTGDARRITAAEMKYMRRTA